MLKRWQHNFRTDTLSRLIPPTDTFSGQWCPIPRDCRELADCIQDEMDRVREDGKRPAFLEYLDEAPKLESEESTSPTKCGDLREYFEYDRDYPDDDRICDEVQDLQVSK